MKRTITTREFNEAGDLVKETVVEEDGSNEFDLQEFLKKQIKKQSPFYPSIPCITQDTQQFDASKCPCNPALGGSGICGCVLSGPRITCSTSTA
jgi:hypothetical protein